MGAPIFLGPSPTVILQTIFLEWKQMRFRYHSFEKLKEKKLVIWFHCQEKFFIFIFSKLHFEIIRSNFSTQWEKKSVLEHKHIPVWEREVESENHIDDSIRNWPSILLYLRIFFNQNQDGKKPPGRTMSNLIRNNVEIRLKIGWNSTRKKERKKTNKLFLDCDKKIIYWNLIGNLDDESIGPVFDMQDDTTRCNTNKSFI